MVRIQKTARNKEGSRKIVEMLVKQARICAGLPYKEFSVKKTLQEVHLVLEATGQKIMNIAGVHIDPRSQAVTVVMADGCRVHVGRRLQLAA